MYRIVKNDIGDLNIPDMTLEDIRGEFETVDERNIYKELLENGKMLARAYAAYGDGEGRMRLLEQLLRLRQSVTNATMLPEGVTDTIFEGEATKLAMLRKDIESSPIEKTLIFVHWNKEIAAMRLMLKDMGHESVVISGKIGMPDRTTSIERFADDVNFLIIQIESGGIGLNLQMASRVYINSLAWNATSELQAIARSHRIGQTKTVTVKRLIINDTIDDHIIGVQQRKLAAAAEVLGDARIEKYLTSKNSVFKSMLEVFK